VFLAGTAGARSVSGSSGRDQLASFCRGRENVFKIARTFEFALVHLPALFSRHGWHQIFVAGKAGIGCVEVVRKDFDPEAAFILEAAKLRANAQQASDIARSAVEKAGVPVAVVRNPVPVSYVRKHAAVGALGFARTVGEVMDRHRSGGLNAVLERLSAEMRGEALVSDGPVRSVELKEKGAFTVGQIAVRSETGTRIVIPVCNEFMAAFSEEEPVVLFPDLISIFDTKPRCLRGPRRYANQGARPVERLLGVQLAPQSLETFLRATAFMQ
jgi:hypothetical protein